jgi:hypothetical protein
LTDDGGTNEIGEAFTVHLHLRVFAGVPDGLLDETGKLAALRMMRQRRVVPLLIFA